MAAARSRIYDVDVAEESANFARQQILVQSGTAMLAQANVLPQSALRLINNQTRSEITKNSKEGVLMIINTNNGSSMAARILGESTSALQNPIQIVL